MRPSGFGSQPVGMIAGSDKRDGGNVGADTVDAEKAGAASGHQGDDELVKRPI